MKTPAALRPFLRLVPALLLLGIALAASSFLPSRTSAQAGGAKSAARPIRILFLGHESELHNSNAYYPMLAKALGPDAIYFDYTTNVAEALDPEYLNRFDGLLLYANHNQITPEQLKTLIDYVESGHGFIPVHSASACFTAHAAFIKLVGGQFKSHGAGVFQTKIVKPEHPAMAGVSEFSCWDESYVHSNHNEENRTVLMVRDPEPGDPITQPEPWTWARTQGEGRVFYTASGHDERCWGVPEFQQLLKSGILWAVGDTVKAEYDAFLGGRTKMKYEKRGDIANYERRPEPLPYQFPLSAEDSMDYTQVPMGWKLELFASEPDIINPIGLAWDERGRLWVAETVDYPNEVRPDHTNGNDKIKILEDTDGDGKCDKVTVFAEGLNIPTSLTFANGGVVISQAPHILFMKDTDGDDVADVKEILMSGWGAGDTHATCANLRYGFDNWVYGSVGYSGFDGEVGGERQKFGMGVFRFRPDGSKLEFLHQFNNNAWGVGFNEAGDVFGSTANNNPSFFGGIPATLYPEGQKGMSAKMIADSPTIHPITPNIRQVDVFGGYTAGAGHTFATSDAFPESYRDKIAFISEPTGRLLGKYRIERDGSGYKALNAFAMVASADDWFAPVAAEVGPDGHLWIADWYNFIIQHNPTPSRQRGGYDAVNGKGNAHINPNRDREHGRIYRLAWEKAPKAAITTLKDADTATLVAALGDGNHFWRLHAQRLLVEGGKKDAEAALKEGVKSGGHAAIHALWSLHGLGLLDRDTHQVALLSPDAGLRRNAIRALGTDETSVQLFFDSAVVTDKDSLVRLAAFNKLAEFPDTDMVTHAAQQLMREDANRNDEWLSQALKLAGAKGLVKGPAKLGPNLLANPSFEEIADGAPVGWRSMNHSGRADFASDDSVARTGKRSARISSRGGADSSWSLSLRVKPETNYRFSCWVKSENVRGAMGAILNIHELQRTGLPEPLRGTADWTELAIDFNSGGHSRLTLNCLFGGWGQSTGTAWWDDASLSEVTYEVVEEAAASEAVGDVANGKVLFDTHLIAACIRCHAVGGQGGVVGPALDGIATRKDYAYILESLVDPGATFPEGYPAEVSPMPPMGVLLKPQELADVMAYLMTLK